jgi:hypothetical protein
MPVRSDPRAMGSMAALDALEGRSPQRERASAMIEVAHG